MSIFVPPPPRQPALASGDQDTRYFDLTADLQSIGTQVSNIVSITAARYDGSASQGGDLAILTNPAPWISVSASVPAAVSAGYVINWWQTGNLTAQQDFVIKVTVQTADGRTLDYSCYQTVLPMVG